jgi:hypothetical protein
MLRRVSMIALVFAAAAGCDRAPSIPQEPQIKTDRDSMGFGLEFNSGTYIGTSPTNSLLIENMGSKDLVISGVDLTNDDGVFSVPVLSATTVKYGKSSVLQEIFTPTQARDYSGQLIIHTNASNEPNKTIVLSGKGLVPPPDAGS